jgi:hypothetical protein
MRKRDMRYHVVAAKARPGYKLWVRFKDGVEGEADLSDIAGRGVFARWNDDPAEFAAVRIDPTSGAPTWPGGLDVAPDRLYAEIVDEAHTVRNPEG